jgi:hypothetical protein
MTYFSLKIMTLPDGVTAEELERAPLDAPTVQDLGQHARACPPYRLSDWAKPRGIKLYYVDNCWVRAAVRGRDLPDFFRDVLKVEPDLSPDIPPDGRYLIQAEEF